MGNLHVEIAGYNRVARPVEFDSTGTLVRGAHPAVTPEILEGQHPIRAWEYARALRALETWIAGPVEPGHGTAHLPHQQHPRTVADVGGAGSQFYRTLIPRGQQGCRIDVIDPTLSTPDGQQGIIHGLLPGATAVKFPLEAWAGYRQNGAAYDAVFCLSVIEHVPTRTVYDFLMQLRTLVRPGGLLVLTCDVGEFATDRYHFHWMRQWIPTPSDLAGLCEEMRAVGFAPLGDDPPDFEYRGPTVYDYTVGSVALVRTP